MGSFSELTEASTANDIVKRVDPEWLEREREGNKELKVCIVQRDQCNYFGFAKFALLLHFFATLCAALACSELYHVWEVEISAICPQIGVEPLFSSAFVM